MTRRSPPPRDPLEDDRCFVRDGELVPMCWGAVSGGADGCYCRPAPADVLALAAMERDLEYARWAAKKRAEEQEADEIAAAAAAWRKGGGRPAIVR